jgi:hypothetical protein
MTIKDLESGNLEDLIKTTNLQRVHKNIYCIPIGKHEENSILKPEDFNFFYISFGNVDFISFEKMMTELSVQCRNGNTFFEVANELNLNDNIKRWSLEIDEDFAKLAI